jgi:hypothetical protein
MVTTSIRISRFRLVQTLRRVHDDASLRNVDRSHDRPNRRNESLANPQEVLRRIAEHLLDQAKLAPTLRDDSHTQQIALIVRPSRQRRGPAARHLNKSASKRFRLLDGPDPFETQQRSALVESARANVQ